MVAATSRLTSQSAVSSTGGAGGSVAWSPSNGIVSSAAMTSRSSHDSQMTLLPAGTALAPTKQPGK